MASDNDGDIGPCPDCKSLDIGKGVWRGYAVLMPESKTFSMGSDVTANVCRVCGTVFGLKALKPDKF